MFKSVNSLINKKYNRILKVENKNSNIENYFKKFLEEQFNKLAARISYSLVYDDKKDTLIIKTKTKIVANELSLRTSDLIKFFRSNSIKLGRIVIQ